MRTLQQILIDANAYLDLDASLPTGTELTVRINYAQQAAREWAAYYRWPQLKSVYQPSLSTLASVSLPSNFSEFTTPPAELLSSGVFRQYPQIEPEQRYEKESTDYYCYVLGNDMEGYTAVFNNLTAGASLSIDYQRHPSSLATLTDVCEVPDPEYVKTKVISYVLQSRGDERFPIVDAEANRLLGNMVGKVMRKPTGGENRILRTGASAYSIGS